MGLYKNNSATIWTTGFLLVFVLFVSVLDYFDFPTTSWGVAEKFTILFKPIFYLFISLFFAIIIFASQNINSTKHSILLNNAIEKIKPFQTAEIYDKIENWLSHKDETKFILFYFPFSFIPGFWINLNLFQRFQAKITGIERKDSICIFFIGPDSENVNFDRFLNALVDENNLEKCYKKNGKNPLWASVEFEELKNQNGNDKTKHSSNVAEEIKEQYKRKINSFIQDTNNKREFIDYHLVEKTNNNFWDNKPKFSFILRMLKTNSKMKFEIIINDTFELTDRFQFTIDYDKIDYHDVLSEPKSYFLADENLSSLFISTILQSFMDDKKLEAFIKKNKIIS